MNRRRFLVTSAGAATLAACRHDPGEPTPAPPADPKLVRIASVPTAVEGHVLPVLVEAFHKQSAFKCAVTVATDLYTQARAGKADLAISHYGHREAEQFVVDGLGEWPRTIFSNLVVLVGPPGDPAKIRGLEDAGEAFRRIAATKSLFVLNELEGLRYLIEILWNLAGKPDRSGWLRDHKQDDALVETAKLGGYTIWGLTPFLRVKQREQLALDPLVIGDPLFERLMVSVLVKPKVGGVFGGINIDGARAFESFLLEPATQALMRTVDYSEDATKIATWAPGGRHNRVAILPKPRL